LATYFRENLRSYLKDWVKKNPKPDGKDYDIYRDGLKVFVTIDSRMQQYAEEAVTEHMSNLQKYFFQEQKKNKKAPFYDIEKEDIAKIINRAKKNSERYKKMKANGKSNKEIEKSFNTKTDMRVFTWKGDRDTIMTPYDSILKLGLVVLTTNILNMMP